MYLDTKGLVTTGTGNLIDSSDAAQALPWLTKDGKRATFAQIAVEWKQIKARQSIRSQGGYAYVKYATLHLDEATVDALLFSVTDKFWTRLKQTLPKIESYPADAQLVLLDLAWQNGAAFLDSKSGGQYVWAGTRAAVLAQDWIAAASHVPGTGRRADRRKHLFTNAATVTTLGLDPDVLWDTHTPTEDDMALTDADVQKIVTAIFTADVIPNTFTSNPENTTVTLLTAFDRIGRQLDEQSAALAEIAKPTVAINGTATPK